MAHARKQLGDWGESVAIGRLEATGHIIRDRNWRVRPSEYGISGEIDIVAEKDRHLAFVEVKTRRGGLPEAQITRRKAKKLAQLALIYLEANNLSEDTDFSIDLMAIELDKSGKVLRIEHVQNAVVEW